MQRIKWMEHRTNEEVLKKVEENRSFMDIIILEQGRRTGYDTF